MRRQRTLKQMCPNPAPPPAIDGLVWASSIQAEDVAWLWPGAIPAGSVSLLEGRKSTGKSTVLAAIAAHVTGGTALPGCGLPKGRPVIWAASEDHWPSTILPRLVAAGALTERVAVPEVRTAKGTPRRLILPDDLLILAEMIQASRAALLVLDPYISLVSPSLDMRVEGQVRTYLEPLLVLMGQTGCTCVMVRHLKKGQGGDARDAGLGSVAVGNCSRSILRCDEHPHRRGEYVLSVVACNLGARRATQSYRIVDVGDGYPAIAWGGEEDLDADAIAEGRGGEALRDEWADADYLLHQVIGSAWIPVRDIQAEAEAAGIGWSTVRRSKARLGIQKNRTLFGEAGHWEWGPPIAGWPPGLGESEPEPEPPPAPKRPRPKRPKASKARMPKSVPSNGEVDTEKPIDALDALDALGGSNGD